MNSLSKEKRAQIIHLLIEGNSLRGTARLANIDYNTVLSFLVKVGEACSKYQHMNLRNLSCKCIQIDEIWSFCYTKEKNLSRAKAAPKGAGDLWTFTALCPDTKLVPTWLVGARNTETATDFIRDLHSRMSGRIQLTSDGFKVYENAVVGTFGADVDYAMLVKQYDGRGHYTGSQKRLITGNPKEEYVSTSLVERQNLTMRMSMRRFIRETSGFSKKVENHCAMVSIYFMYYNYARIHSSLKVTPAIEAGIENRIWSLEEIVDLAYENEVYKPRGAYSNTKLTRERISK